MGYPPDVAECYIYIFSSPLTSYVCQSIKKVGDMLIGQTEVIRKVLRDISIRYEIGALPYREHKVYKDTYYRSIPRSFTRRRIYRFLDSEIKDT